MKHRTHSDKTYSLLQGITTGTAAALCMIIAATALLAILIVNGKIKPDMIMYAPAGILLLATYFGGVIANKLIQKQYAIISAIIGGVLFILLLGMHIFFFNGSFVNVAGVLGGTAAGTLGSCLTFIAPKKTRRKTRNR